MPKLRAMGRSIYYVYREGDRIGPKEVALLDLLYIITKVRERGSKILKMFQTLQIDGP